MSEKRLSHCQGKGSLTHNNRKFNAKNVDDTRTKNNIIFIQQPIEEAYERLFGTAVERYNAKQKRADRKIKTSYFRHIFKRDISQSVVTAADKRKSFYEDVVQIGDMKNTGIGTPDAEIVTACLTEYMQGFQKRNPNFYVFNAVLHLDEATPHLHIDYIPIGHYKSGIDTRNGIAQALKEMGYGSGKETIARWREAECKVLTEICARHGIQIAAPEKSRGSLTVEQYKEYAKVKEQVEEKKEEVSRLDERAECADKLLKHREELRTQVESVIDELDEQYQEKNAAVAHLDEQIEEKSSALTQTAAELADKQSQLETSAGKVAKLKSISEIETGKTMFSGKVTLSRDDYGALTDLAMKQIAAESKECNLNTEIARLNRKIEEQDRINNAQKQELKSFRTLNEELRKVKYDFNTLQQRFQKVMNFIKSLGLAEKLQEFLIARTRGIKR
ncbi:MAG TPA: recombinase [Ruminococcaceae bacterium]|nr:recombinase [Oscillospiraceae bacterium]